MQKKENGGVTYRDNEGCNRVNKEKSSEEETHWEEAKDG